MRDEPLLLVLDEPTAALDAETEHALFERFAEAARTKGDRTGRHNSSFRTGSPRCAWRI
jgi:ATP-binding cassette subfamily B protein